MITARGFSKTLNSRGTALAKSAERLVPILAEEAGDAGSSVIFATPEGSRVHTSGRGAPRDGSPGGVARPRGDRGFGYDPAFLPDDGPEGLTMAELPDVAKDAISHRGHALRALVEWLRRRDVERAPAETRPRGTA